ncbi:MAG TPA: LysE family translocator [Candidatus Limnocylindria bacterium]|nr:LysE family translocator [Candidatus Limnocylindria bacterium]
MEAVAAFLGIAALVIVTPGQDTLLTIRNTVLGGRAGGTMTAVGVALGQAIWTVAASAGVTAVLAASEPAFAALRLAGAVVLLYLGGQSLIAALRGDATRHVATERRRLGAAAALRQGLVSNLGNPKMAVFFTSLLPQFVTAGPAAFVMMLALGLVFCAMTLAWLSLYAVAVARAGHVLGRPRIRRALDAAVGAVLVGFGVRLATQQR